MQKSADVSRTGAPKRTGSLRRAAVTVSLLTVTATLGSAPSAYAGSACDWSGCSETINQSAYSVHVARDWCSGNNGPCAGSPTSWIAPGSRTPVNQDWDAFRVDAGWCYRVNWNPGVGDLRYDQRGKGHRWIKVLNPEEAVIEFQSTTSCG